MTPSLATGETESSISKTGKRTRGRIWVDRRSKETRPVSALRDPEVTNSQVADRVRELADTAPDQLAVVGTRSRCTYRELDRAVDQATTDFARRGVRPGTRVAWLRR